MDTNSAPSIKYFLVQFVKTFPTMTVVEVFKASVYSSEKLHEMAFAYRDNHNAFFKDSVCEVKKVEQVEGLITGVVDLSSVVNLIKDKNVKLWTDDIMILKSHKNKVF